MRRFLVKIQYDGRHYSGWQKQKNAKTVQGEIDEALTKLFGGEIRSVGCSRTDAGVSAEEYYFHFDADTKL
ncbi:MAG: tRNA pseudouridine(38-40) synthase TruA, partial [Christensenellaceae bacterium]